VFIAAADEVVSFKELAEAASRSAGGDGRAAVWPLDEARGALGLLADLMSVNMVVSGAKARRILGRAPPRRPATGRVSTRYRSGHAGRVTIKGCVHGMVPPARTAYASLADVRSERRPPHGPFLHESSQWAYHAALLTRLLPHSDLLKESLARLTRSAPSLRARGPRQARTATQREPSRSRQGQPCNATRKKRSRLDATRGARCRVREKSFWERGRLLPVPRGRTAGRRSERRGGAAPFMPFC